MIIVIVVLVVLGFIGIIVYERGERIERERISNMSVKRILVCPGCGAKYHVVTVRNRVLTGDGCIYCDNSLKSCLIF